PASFRPWTFTGRALTVFYGCHQVLRLSHYFLPGILAKGRRVLYLDGGNQINPLLIARFARERREEPETFNRLIRVSRSFTCFQLTELIARAPEFLKKFAAEVVMVTALPDLYFDEDVREQEARTAFGRALEALQHAALAERSVVIFSDATSMPTARQAFFPRLAAQAEQVVRIGAQASGGLVFTSEKEGRRELG
ncbi:MAG: hypothetical protein ACRD5L_15050, partial [Bryobacteraceae bacterium]